MLERSANPAFLFDGLEPRITGHENRVRIVSRGTITEKGEAELETKAKSVNTEMRRMLLGVAERKV
jgi:hypothetical protein